MNSNEVKMYYSTFVITIASNFGIMIEHNRAIPILFKINIK